MDNSIKEELALFINWWDLSEETLSKLPARVPVNYLGWRWVGSTVYYKIISYI